MLQENPTARESPADQGGTPSREAPTVWEVRQSLLLQCVVGDPASALYADAFLLHLRQFDHTKKRFSLGRWTRQAGLVSSALRQDWSRVLSQAPSVLAEDPGNMPVLLALIDAHHASGHRESAWRYAEEGLRLSPNDVELGRRCGRVTASFGWFERSADYWRQVAQARSSDPEARRMLAVLAFSSELDRSKLAGDDVSRPGDVDSLLAAIDTALEEDGVEQAEALLQQGLAVCGQDSRLQDRRESIQLARHRRQVTLARRLAAADPQPVWQLLVDQLNDSLSRLELELLVAQTRRYPTDPLLHARLGRLLAQQRKWDEAARCWQVATEAEDPRVSGLAWHELGEIRQRGRQFSEARDCYGRSLALAMGEGTREIRLRALARAATLAEACGDFVAAEAFRAERTALTPRQDEGNPP
ncbi:MAG: hypothetical protein U1A77_07075 [Pirellulales bacterium]